jgi:hypothetical protein
LFSENRQSAKQQISESNECIRASQSSVENHGFEQLM